MSLGIDALIDFNDAPGFRGFNLAHRFAHDQIAAAIKTQKGFTISTAGISSHTFEDQVINLMRYGAQGQKPKNTPTVDDWLQLHYAIHNVEYQSLGLGSVPDMSVLMFSDKQSFYDWMYAHLQLHQLEAQSLGLN